MFKKLAFVFIIFVLIISCRKATTRPSISDVGEPPSEEGVPDIPDITPPDSQEDYYIKADDTEETIKSKIQKYYEKHGIYVALIDDTKDNIEANGTIEKVNKIINENTYEEGVFLDLSKTDMTKLADNSFSENKNLSSVKLPDTLTTIGVGAFSNAQKLAALNFPYILAEIGDGAFYGCISLQRVDLGYTQIKVISKQSFDNCSKLEEVILPNGVLTINEKAFNYCGNLAAINFPPSLIKIGNGAFLSCTSLEEVNLKETKITILNEQVFNSCDKLSKVVLPDVLLTIENNVFAYCISLEEITLPSNVEVIKQFVFDGCEKLKKVNLNNKLKSINSYAFYGCSSLSSISFPSSLEVLGESGIAEIFTDCISLSDVEYLGTNPDAVTWFGNIFDNSMPQNLYLPNVDDPTASNPPQDPNPWESFLGYDWTDKIKYKQYMPSN